MIVTTFDSIQGRKITKYLGIVSGSVFKASYAFSDLTAAIDAGRLNKCKSEAEKAVKMAIEDMVGSQKSWEPMQ